MNRVAKWSAAALVLAACSSSTGPLPCLNDLNCPVGAYCEANGFCGAAPGDAGPQATAPGAPTGVTAIAGAAEASVSWTPPANNGGSALTGFVVKPYIGAAAGTPVTVPNGAATSADLTGLVNGTAYTFTVEARNSVGDSAESSPSNSVTPSAGAPGGLTYGENPATYIKGAPIAPNLASSTGAPIVSYSVAPALPAGLTLDTGGGSITGTPTAVSAMASYKITGTNPSGAATVVLVLAVNDLAPAGLTYRDNPASYTNGTAIAPNTPSSTGGTILSYAVLPSLPLGLELDPGTGVISGTPALLSPTADYLVTGTNGSGSTSAALSITVSDLVPGGLAYAEPHAIYTKGVAITPNTPSSTGGVITSYEIAPALPPGLSFNHLTGIISGTPSLLSPVATYIVTGSNSSGDTSAGVSITVDDAAPTNLDYLADAPVYTKGVAIVANTPTAAGGAVLVYSLSQPLPPGLVFDGATGAITGTPTMLSAPATYTVTAANSGGQTSKALVITVDDVPPAIPAYTGGPFVCTLNASCGVAAPGNSGAPVLSYSISPALPAGLAFNTGTGAISGVATVLSPAANYQVTANNSGGQAVATLSIAVVDVAPSGLTYSSQSLTCTIHQACALAAPTHAGGSIVSYAVTPALPAGMLLSATTGALGGAATVLAPSTIYKITAANSGGAASFNLTLAINDVKPANLTYAQLVAAYTKGSTITSNVPSSTGGPVVSYSVLPPLPAGLSIDAATGVISGTPSVISTANEYTVTATNTGGSTSAQLSIAVNDIAPGGLSYQVNPAVYTKGTAIASNAPVSPIPGAMYSVTPQLPPGLAIDAASGAISGTPNVVTATATYTVVANDTGGSTSTNLSITVNDTPPSSLAYSAALICTVNAACQSVAPTSAGGLVVSYAATGLPAGLSVGNDGVVSGTPTRISSAASYTITAINSGGSTTAMLWITIQDVAPTSLSYPALGCTISSPCQSAAPSVSGVNVVYSATALPAGLSINSASGVVSGTPTAEKVATSYTITATNTGGSTTGTLSIVVKDIAPSALAYPALACTVGLGCTSAAPTVSGVNVVYSASGLPAGLSVGSSGVISGTPTAQKAATAYTITASNTGGSTTGTITITINDAPPSGLGYPALSCTLNASCTSAAASVTGANVVYSAAGLPAGLGINTATGVISGAPSAQKAATAYTITATNTGGSTTGTISIAVNDVAPSALSYAGLVCTINSNCASAVPAVSGANVTYSATALPAGMSINASTGVVSGTPVAQRDATSYTVTATNTGGSTAGALSITVNDVPPSALSYAALICSVNSACHSAAPSATGINLVYSAVGLPPGMSIAPSTGVISGTPTAQSGPTSYTVTETNSGGGFMGTISITVNDATPSSPSYAALSCTLGMACQSAAPSITGANIVYSAANLPAGMSISSTTGIVSGTPTAQKTSTNYTVTATNSGGSSTGSISITVNDVASSGLSYAALTCTIHSGCASATPSASGQNLVFAASTLPVGLSINSTTGVISGTPTTQKAATSYTVTATNSGGTTTGSISITVNDVAPGALTYASMGCTLNAACRSANPTASGLNLVYSVSGLPAGLSISAATGVISGMPTAQQAATSYTVTVTNSGGSSSGTISIAVNDVAPGTVSYTDLTCTVGSNCQSGAPTAAGANLSYSASGLPAGLSIAPATGIISGAPSGQSAGTSYTVTATNSGGSSTGTISITVNDVAPSALHYPDLTCIVSFSHPPCMSAPPTVTGINIVYSAANLPPGLTINASTGVISGSTSQQAATISYPVTATNTGGATTGAIAITANDAPPGSVSFPSLVCFIGTACASAPPSAQGNNVTYSATGLPNGLSLNSSTGVVSGMATVQRAATNYNIVASNTGGSLTGTMTITVNDAAPSNVNYAAMVCTINANCTSGTPNTTAANVIYSASSLPAGLALNSTTGVVSGVPTAQKAATNYTIGASNTGGLYNASISITINDVAPSNLAYATALTCTVGSNCASATPTVTGQNVVYSAASLPVGMGINPSTGVISGSPTTEKVATSYAITATNSGGPTTATLTIAVNDVTPTALSYPALTCTLNSACASASPAISGVHITYSATSLPTGMTINSATGVVSGTPTAQKAQTSYAITASNTGGATSGALLITVNDIAPAAPTYSSALTCQVNSACASVAPSTTGANLVYSASTLPAGMSITSSTGVIAGTPTTLMAATNYPVTATNTGGSSTGTLSIAVVDTVAPALGAPAFITAPAVTLASVPWYSQLYSTDIEVDVTISDTGVGVDPSTLKLVNTGTSARVDDTTASGDATLKSGNTYRFFISRTGPIPYAYSGSVTFKATASDLSGNAGSSAAATLGIDGNSPQPTLITPQAVDASIGGIFWYNQLIGSEILIYATVADTGTGIDTTTLQLVNANNGTRIDDPTAPSDATLLSGTLYQFYIKRSGGAVASGAQASFPIQVKVSDKAGNMALGTSTTIGIDGQAPTLSFSNTTPLSITAVPSYPANDCPTGTAGLQTGDVCGHDGSHFYRKNETVPLAFYVSDSTTGAGIASSTAAIVSCTITGAASAIDCLNGATTNKGSYVSVDGNRTFKFQFTPDFSAAAFTTSTSGTGSVNLKIVVKDQVGNQTTLDTSARANPVGVTRVRWIRKVGTKVNTFVTSAAAAGNAAIYTTVPSTQIIFAGNSVDNNGTIISFGPDGTLLWRAGASGSIVGIAYSSKTHLLYASSSGAQNGFAASTAFHITAAGVDTYATLDILNGMSPPMIIEGTSVEYAAVSEYYNDGDSDREFISIYHCSPTASGGSCTSTGVQQQNDNDTGVTPTSDGTNIYFAGYNDSVTRVPFTVSNGGLGAAVEGSNTSSQGAVAVLSQLYTADYATSATKYLSYNKTTLAAAAGYTAPVGANAIQGPPIIGANSLFGSFNDGKLHAYSPTTGAAQYVYPGSGSLGSTSLVGLGSDTGVYMGGDAPKQLIALSANATAASLSWSFTGSGGINISSVITEPTLDAAGTLYFADNAGDVFAIISDSPSYLAPVAGSNWPRAGFDNCNSSNTAMVCQ